MGVLDFLNEPIVKGFLKLGAEIILPPEQYFELFGLEYSNGAFNFDDGDGYSPRRAAALEEVKRKDGSVSVWIGTRDTGKTVGSQREAEYLGRPVFGISPEQKLPSWIEPIKMKDINKLPSRITLIVEDTPVNMGNRDYNEEVVQTLEKIIPMVRHTKKWHLIFNTQSSAQADKYILDCDLAFFKPQGILMGDVERPNIQKIYTKYVNPFFENRSQSWMRQHVLMIARSYIGGMLIAKVPEKMTVIETRNENGVYEPVGTVLVDKVETNKAEWFEDEDEE